MLATLRTAVLPILALSLFAAPGRSQAGTATPIQAIPPVVGANNARPMIVLNMSRDHQLFYRAYTEFADLDGDGQIETTYKTTYAYYGYFDTQKCYEYVSTDGGRFEPRGSADATTHYCLGNVSGMWSGNFLNWASMTRMDVVRRVLYGGYRSTDTPNLTVLERAHLPTDGHSFAKYYNLSDVSKLTPFSDEITLCNTTHTDGQGDDQWSHTTKSPPLLRVARGNYQLWNANERWQCLWREERVTGNSITQDVMPGVWDINPVRDIDGLQANSLGPDFVVRVKVCDPKLMGGETEKCGTYPRDTVAKSYSYKPTGLLQKFSNKGLAEFALLSGSFDTNISGGVLRSAMGDFNNEIDQATGIFKKNISGSTLAASEGIVKTLDALRIYGYDYSSGTHWNPSSIGAQGQFCGFQTIGLTEGTCVSWGNPMGEMLLESLRYLAGTKQPTAEYMASSSPRDALLGLPRVTNWDDPLSQSAARTIKFGKAQCRPTNVVNFNASVISYDGLPGSVSIGDISVPVGDKTDAIGATEGVYGSTKQWFVGEVNGSGDSRCTAKTVAQLSQVDGLCPDAPGYKGTFSSAGLAYFAHTNRIRKSIPGVTISDFWNYPDLDMVTGFVDTYSVALSPGKPRIQVKVGDKTAVIQPAYTLNRPDGMIGSGTLVDFRVLETSADGSHGKYLVIWDDSEQGGDYDQDAGGILEYKVTGGKLYVTTSVFVESTDNPQGFGYTISGTDKDGAHYHSGILGFNFTDGTNLTVTTVAGEAHPKINSSGGCANCQEKDPPSQAVYEVRGGAGQSLEDPLWYAAKWGGFARKSSSPSEKADGPKPAGQKGNWDSGTGGTAGTPDNYFLVFDPGKLESALETALNNATTSQNTTPAISSGRLTVGGVKYVASYNPDPKVKSGEVSAFEIDSTGDFGATPVWLASQKLTSVAPSARVVITDDFATSANGTSAQVIGKPLRSDAWATLSTSYQDALTTSGTPLVDMPAKAQKLIDYMHGDRSNEGTGLGFRVRPSNNILGEIVNSTPWVQVPASARYTGAQFTYNGQTYGSWASQQASNNRVLWVGSNDGMLHGFQVLRKRTDSGGASLAAGALSIDGAPLMSYAPGALAARFPSLVTGSGGESAMVDGSPYTADVYANNGWKTYLFGSLGRGGRAIYTLDVTNASQVASSSGASTASRESTAAAMFQWRFTADDDSDLGYVLGDPMLDSQSGQASSIIKLNNNGAGGKGDFALVFGNGYQSTDGKAALFIIPVKGTSNGVWQLGSNYYKLVAETASKANGLSAPAWIDTDGNGTADVIYAGDLQGNMWKFDISSADPSNWAVAACSDSACNGKALFVAKDGAGNRLPITTAPTFAAPEAGGLMVLFGTGKAIETSDFPDSKNHHQRMFGIWDRSYLSDLGGVQITYPMQDYTRLKERLVERVSSGANTFVQLQAGDPGGFNPAEEGTKYDGWFMDLPGKSEMVIYNPFITSDTLVFTTVRPKNTDLEGSCSSEPQGTLFFMDPVSGGPSIRIRWLTGASSNALGLDISDTRITRSLDSTTKARVPTQCLKDDPACPCHDDASKTCERAPTCLPAELAQRFVGKTTDLETCVSSSQARIQWREIPGLKTK